MYLSRPLHKTLTPTSGQYTCPTHTPYFETGAWTGEAGTQVQAEREARHSGVPVILREFRPTPPRGVVSHYGRPNQRASTIAFFFFSFSEGDKQSTCDTVSTYSGKRRVRETKKRKRKELRLRKRQIRHFFTSRLTGAHSASKIFPSFQAASIFHARYQIIARALSHVIRTSGRQPYAGYCSPQQLSAPN